jgi:phospholipase C
MDGSDKVPLRMSAHCVPGANPQFRYVDNSTGAVQPYFDLAMQYGFANRMFQSNQGPSFPAHQFLISGTSAPSDDSPLFAAGNSSPSARVGCESVPGATVQMVDPNGIYSLMYPCFDHGTLVDLLEGAGLSWRYYVGKISGGWAAPNAITGLCKPEPVDGLPTCSGDKWKNVIGNPAKFLTDVQACHLANVSWVVPMGKNSDHPQYGDGGPSWVASIVNTIATNPACSGSKEVYWEDTAILVTWDDWGGWYDHVPPYRIGQSNGWGRSYVYGFRVPLLVISAYTPAGHVSNTNHDFGSMLKFVETNFGLGLIGPGTFADSYADDLMEFFTWSPPKRFQPIRSKYDANHFINSTDPPSDPDDD